LLREGCNCVQDNPHLWIKWAELETECENLGDIETKYRMTVNSVRSVELRSQRLVAGHAPVEQLIRENSVPNVALKSLRAHHYIDAISVAGSQPTLRIHQNSALNVVIFLMIPILSKGQIKGE
ncbi:MAG: hypothetical protein J6A54_06750, partial [Clostridia bacterium]|nr:hypothetical protein [Clostridia bacterium]